MGWNKPYTHFILYLRWPCFLHLNLVLPLVTQENVAWKDMDQLLSSSHSTLLAAMLSITYFTGWYDWYLMYQSVNWYKIPLWNILLQIPFNTRIYWDISAILVGKLKLSYTRWLSLPVLPTSSSTLLVTHSPSPVLPMSPTSSSSSSSSWFLHYSPLLQHKLIDFLLVAYPPCGQVPPFIPF